MLRFTNTMKWIVKFMCCLHKKPYLKIDDVVEIHLHMTANVNA